ncbi:MAG: hypothetical protein BroJett038_32240 [Chloroflexota bacterium]|jgi:hypothetical protein|nr:MAG: hypothetical protein BroJett038_32240 [Chloroflexota bacterium]
MLHEETRSQWERYNPQHFINTVMHGALQDKIKLTSTVIHVYTQIIFRLPETDAVRLADPMPGDLPTTGLRDVFVTMRWNAAEMVDIIQGGSATLPTQYTPALYITSMVQALKEHAVYIHQAASALQSDPAVRAIRRRLPNGKGMAEVAAEILDHTTEIIRFLNFAQYYVDKLKTCA